MAFTLIKVVSIHFLFFIREFYCYCKTLQDSGPPQPSFRRSRCRRCWQAISRITDLIKAHSAGLHSCVNLAEHLCKPRPDFHYPKSPSEATGLLSWQLVFCASWQLSSCQGLDDLLCWNGLVRRWRGRSQLFNSADDKPPLSLSVPIPSFALFSLSLPIQTRLFPWH